MDFLLKNIAEIFQELLDLPMDPTQRFYWVSLLTSLVSVWVLIHFKEGPRSTWNTLRTKLFNKKILLHPSSKLDLKILLLNIFLKVLIVTPLLGSSFYFSLWILKTLRTIAPEYSDTQSLSPLAAAITYTLLSFIISDFARFIHHFGMHKLFFLRNFHRLHHSAEVLTPLTLMRAHPIEMVLAQIRNMLTYALALAISVYLFPNSISSWDILGVNAFGMLFNLLGANLRHTSIALSFGPLEYLFISPRMHQIHHSQSPIHQSKNFGVSLSIWDQLVGSFYKPKNGEENKLIYGIKNAKLEESRKLSSALIYPFFNLKTKVFSTK